MCFGDCRFARYSFDTARVCGITIPSASKRTCLISASLLACSVFRSLFQSDAADDVSGAGRSIVASRPPLCWCNLVINAGDGLRFMEARKGLRKQRLDFLAGPWSAAIDPTAHSASIDSGYDKIELPSQLSSAPSLSMQQGSRICL